jgi:hypothetical protein
MGSTFVGNKDQQGFWIPEAFVEVLSNFLCKAFEEVRIEELTPNLQRMYDRCDGNRSGEYTGIVGLHVKDIVSEDEINQLLRVIDCAKKIISLSTRK